MKKLGLVVAVVAFLLTLAVGIAAAASLPGGSVTGANASGLRVTEASTNSSKSSATDSAATGEQRTLITDASIFSQFGFCDDDDSSPAY